MLLQTRDFRRDPDDPARFERYQAEALIHRHLPVNDLLSIVCYTEHQKQAITQQLQMRNLALPVQGGTSDDDIHTSYLKTFFLRISMKDGLEMKVPMDCHISRALAFFLRVVAVTGLIYAIRWW